MQPIPNASINFTFSEQHNVSLPKDESKMTKVFKLFGVITGDEQEYCTLHISDWRLDPTTIRKITRRK